jgi:hypothetical protein
LLEILGQAQNPAVIENHLKKLFMGIHSVGFSDDHTQIKAVRLPSPLLSFALTPDYAHTYALTPSTATAHALAFDFALSPSFAFAGTLALSCTLLLRR